MRNVLLTLFEIIYRLKITLYELKAWYPLGSKTLSRRLLVYVLFKHTHTSFFYQFDFNAHPFCFECSFYANFLMRNSRQTMSAMSHHLNVRINWIYEFTLKLKTLNTIHSVNCIYFFIDQICAKKFLSIAQGLK